MTVKSRTQIKTDADTVMEDNSSGNVTPADVRETIKDFADSVLFLDEARRGHLFGLSLANNASDLTNDIDIAIGEAASEDASPAMMVLGSALTKQLDAAWAVGTNAGMRATGVAIADGTYHIFLIRRSDTGVVDIAADTSASGANIAANTNAAYTQKRRIGSILRESSAIFRFKQDGDCITREPVRDVMAVNPGISAVTRTLSVPSGIVVNATVLARLRDATFGGTGIRAYVSSLAMPDTAPSTSVRQVEAEGPTGGVIGAFSVFDVITDTSRQVRSRISISDADIQFDINTLGWWDTRGR